MTHPRHNTHHRAPLGLIAGAIIMASIVLLGVVVALWLGWQSFSLAWPLTAQVLQFVFYGSIAAAPVVSLVLVAARWIRPRYIDAYHSTQMMLAQRSQGLPVNVQSLSYHDSSKALPPPQIEIAPLQIGAAPVAPPSLIDAINRQLSTPEQWLIGVSQDGAPQVIALKHTGFIALSGVQGTGKSNMAALLAAQGTAHGGTLFIADPHYGDQESLSARIQPLSGAVAAFAQTPDQINAMIAKIESIYQHRSANPGNYPALLLIIDEFMDLMLRKELTDQSMRTLLALSSTGRKKKMYAVLISANWNMRALGGYGVGIRQNVTHALAFNSSIETAELLLPQSYAQQVLMLKTGQTLYWARGAEPTLTITPEVQPADMAYAARGRVNTPPPALSPASAPLQGAPQQPSTLPPTTRVAPPVAAPPTVGLALTNADQVLMTLDGAQRHLTATEIASRLGWDIQLTRTVIDQMFKAGQLTRQRVQGKRTNETYEYTRAINKSRPSGPLVASA